MSIENGKITEGEAAPLFTLNDQNGQPWSLQDQLGKYVIVYFYPRDDTPGCTKESCGFRDSQETIAGLNAITVGISPDDADSHQAFIDKFQLPFTLLSDPDKSVMEPYGAWGEKKMYGKTSVGVIRSTVIIDPEGKVVKHWKRVPDAGKHPAKVLEVLQSL